MGAFFVGFVAVLAGLFVWIVVLERGIGLLERRVLDLHARLCLVEGRGPFRPMAKVDDVKDLGVELPAEQDVVDAWAEEQERAGRRVSEEEVGLQRRMRYEEGM